jgi:hypothetical protein
MVQIMQSLCQPRNPPFSTPNTSWRTERPSRRGLRAALTHPYGSSTSFMHVEWAHYAQCSVRALIGSFRNAKLMKVKSSETFCQRTTLSLQP